MSLALPFHSPFANIMVHDDSLLNAKIEMILTESNKMTHQSLALHQCWEAGGHCTSFGRKKETESRHLRRGSQTWRTSGSSGVCFKNGGELGAQS